MREIATLRRHGISTITDLVGADLDELLTWYLPEVTHRPGAEGRLRVAARRARMLLDGSSFARETDGPIDGARRATSRSTSTSRARRTAGSTCGDSWSSTPRHRAGSITSSAGSTISTMPPRPRWPSTRSPGCAAWSTPRRRSRSTTTAGTRRPRSGRSPTASSDAVLDWAADVRRGAVRRPAGDRQGPLLRGQRARPEADRQARRLQLARRRSRRAQLPAVVRRGGARRRRPRSGPQARTPGAGLQRGRRDRHQPAQSVAASPVIAASSVRRWLRSMTASTNSMPTGGSCSTSTSSVGVRHPAIGGAGGLGQGGELGAVRRAEDPLERRADGRAARAPGWRRCCRRRRWRPRSADRATARRAR